MAENPTPQHILEQSEQLCTAQELASIIGQMAQDISKTLSDQCPVVLCVMNGAVIFTGHLLPQLNFPLYFSYVHGTRYHETTRGGELSWKVAPPDDLKDQVVLVLDDVLDEGWTLAAIRERVIKNGARAFYSAVLVDKIIARDKPLQADFVGITLPDRYIFGFGMDIHGMWRNLPTIYALKQ
ncbi:hypoxanthine-guanine phosphoribosyltransferase [Nitrosomonas sp. ANs5]|uniref:hypoxanthine-guanine phosphoribosyltransferase n=1 Tax=Nitrosomonas sp. ANs5 TaxID=3423941 RepID=UPI003D3407C7